MMRFMSGWMCRSAEIEVFVAADERSEAASGGEAVVKPVYADSLKYRAA